MKLAVVSCLELVAALLQTGRFNFLIDEFMVKISLHNGEIQVVLYRVSFSS